MMKKLFYLSIALSLAILSGCESDNPEPEISSNFTNGAFIINEGGFDKNNASLSFYSADSMNMTNYIYKAFASQDLGDIFQSMSIIDNKAYLVINNSQKIEVFNLKSYTSTKITDLSYPRYIQEVKDGKAYISNGNGFGQDYIFVLNTKTNEITDSIKISVGPESFLSDGSDIYVACKGGYSVDSTVYVIDANTDKITDTINVGQVPVEMEKDASGNIWVLCNGRNIYNEDWSSIIKTIPGQLMRIDPINKTVTKTVNFNAPISGYGTNNLAMNPDGTVLYINNGNIQAYDIAANTFSTIIPNAYWYGIDVNPKTGNIWGSLSSGKVQVYTKEGNRLNEYQAGANTSGVVFVD